MIKLHIDAQTTFREISRFFHEQFPYLQIRFFTAPHAPGEGSARAGMIQDLDAGCGARGSADYVANAEITATGLETWFENSLGLHVQVFRKSGSVWLETTGSGDELTLARLNAKGREHDIATKADQEPVDFREQE